MPITIDGAEISGCTIDGEEVQEITIDGAVAWERDLTLYDNGSGQSNWPTEETRTEYDFISWTSSYVRLYSQCDVDYHDPYNDYLPGSARITSKELNLASYNTLHVDCVMYDNDGNRSAFSVRISSYINEHKYGSFSRQTFSFDLSGIQDFSGIRIAGRQPYNDRRAYADLRVYKVWLD